MCLFLMPVEAKRFPLTFERRERLWKSTLNIILVATDRSTRYMDRYLPWTFLQRLLVCVVLSPTVFHPVTQEEEVAVTEELQPE